MKIVVKPIELSKRAKSSRAHLGVPDEWYAHIGKEVFAQVFFCEGQGGYWFEPFHPELFQFTPERPKSYKTLEECSGALHRAITRMYSDAIRVLAVEQAKPGKTVLPKPGSGTTMIKGGGGTGERR